MAAEVDWRDVQLEEVAAPTRNALVGGPFGSDLVTADYSSHGVPVIRGENLSSGRWVGGDFVFVPPAKAQQLAANTAGPLDIIFTQRGANHYRQVAVVPAHRSIRLVISQSQMKLTVDPEKADPLFIYYIFRSPAQQDYLQRHAIQTGVPHTNLSILRKAPLRIPSLSTQRAIVHVLGTLDDKIELNQRMNETLEAMARALFKAWFVDFDPVRAKAEGRDPCLPKAVAELLPNSFEDSELGEIPKGWEAGTLADYASLNPESWSKDSYPDMIEYVDLSNTKWGSIDSTSMHTRQNAPSRAQRVLRPGDTIVGTVRPGNGSYAQVVDEGLTGSTGFAVLRPHTDTYQELIYLAGTTPENIERLSHLADGGAYPAIRPDVVLATEVTKPTVQVIERFAGATKPFLAKMAQNQRESRTLAALRDALLPRLISGKLRVRNIDKPAVARA